MTLRLDTLTYTLRGGLFQVQNEVGLGRSEESYHRAVCHWMTENKITFESKPAYPLMAAGPHVLDLIPDLVVEGRLVMELKAKPCHLTMLNALQFYNDLKRSGLSLGMLCNLGVDRVQIDRHLYEPKTLSHDENKPVGSSTLDCLIINDDTIFCHTCLFDDNSFNGSRADAFRKALSIKHAVAVNFGKRIMQVR